MTRLFGLVGYPLTHSFSKKYFEEKFCRERLPDCSYENFPLPDIAVLPELIRSNQSLRGLNITIPHKETVIKYLDELSQEAAVIGSVNCIKITSGKCKGYNTDYVGFLRSLKKYLQPYHTQALVLGTGGSSKAVEYALRLLQITTQKVSRKKITGVISYEELNEITISRHLLIVNTTPLGMAMSAEEQSLPNIPYEHLSSRHILFDLVYNPPETPFILAGKMRGAVTVNGEEMLQIQAEESWKIWNSFW